MSIHHRPENSREPLTLQTQIQADLEFHPFIKLTVSLVKEERIKENLTLTAYL